jgi:hypothetical protein
VVRGGEGGRGGWGGLGGGLGDNGFVESSGGGRGRNGVTRRKTTRGQILMTMNDAADCVEGGSL